MSLSKITQATLNTPINKKEKCFYLLSGQGYEKQEKAHAIQQTYDSIYVVQSAILFKEKAIYPDEITLCSLVDSEGALICLTDKEDRS